jgi:hypothetical protein
VALTGLDLGGDAGGDLRLVDVVDDDLDAHAAAPVLDEPVEPLVVAGHEVAPQQDAQGARQLAGGLGGHLRGGRRVVAGAHRTRSARRAGLLPGARLQRPREGRTGGERARAA